jgi:hypothetical protein
MKYIITTILIIYLIRLVAPFLLRWLLALFVKKSIRNGSFFHSNMKQQQRQYQDFHQNNSQQNAKANGGVKIDYVPDQPDSKDFKGGEYVDYEEVK